MSDEKLTDAEPLTADCGPHAEMSGAEMYAWLHDRAIHKDGPMYERVLARRVLATITQAQADAATLTKGLERVAGELHAANVRATTAESENAELKAQAMTSPTGPTRWAELEELARKATPGKRVIVSREASRGRNYVNGATIRTAEVVIARVSQTADKPISQ